MTRKILVADDSITIQRVVSLAFADEDVQVEAVASGDLAIAKARTLRPDIVFADVFMPGSNGYEVCHSIKSDPALAGIRVVLMVGTFEPFDAEEAERVRCDGHLMKPFDPGELLHTFRTLTAASPGAEQSAPGPAEAALPRTNAAAPRAPLVSQKARDSFLGSDRILDLLSPGKRRRKAPRLPPGAVRPVESAAAAPAAAEHVVPAADTVPGEPPAWPPLTEEKEPLAIPQELLRSVVEDVVRRMAPDIIREIAWEVVPDLSEGIVRQAAASANLRNNPAAEPTE